MQNKEIEVIEVDGLNYMIVDRIEGYTYTINMNDSNDMIIFETSVIDGEEVLEEVLDNKEAIELFYNKHEEFIETI